MQSPAAMAAVAETTQCLQARFGPAPAVAVILGSGWGGVVDVQEFWRHGIRRDAILGPAFFRDRRVTVDWEKRELVFAPRR